MEQRARAPLADDEMCLDVGLAQPLQQPDAVNHPCCAGHSDDQFHENPKTQIPSPKSQEIPSSAGVWDLGCGIWDLGFTYRYYRPNVSSSAGRLGDLQLVRRARRRQR